MNVTEDIAVQESAENEVIEEKKRPRRRSHFRKYLPYYLMMLPGLVILLVNNYMPMFGVVIAFKRFRYSDNFISSFINSEWVGFNNFRFIFQSPDVINATRNTIVYNLIFIALDLIVPVIVAIALNEIWNKGASKFYQSAAFLPYFMSWIVVAYLGMAFLNWTGVANRVLSLFGIGPINWYFETKAWPFIIIFFHMWKYTGYNIVVYVASLSGIDDEYYEAAVLDGASKWQQIRYITLPMLKTVMIILTLFAVGRIFNSDFGLFYNVPRNQGQLYPVTQTIDTYVYNAMTTINEPGMTTAAGLYQAVCGCITVLIANFCVRKIDKEQALF